MIDAETNAEIKRIDAENHRQNERIKILEVKVDNITQMNVAMQKMADNMEHMYKEQERQGALIEKQDTRLEKLEGQPAEAWSSMRRTILTTICGAAAGALAIALFRAIAMFI